MLKQIFIEPCHRNIISYLTYDDIKNLFLVNKSFKKHIHRLENREILDRIKNRRFFDRKKGKIYKFDITSDPKFFTISSCPTIDHGDIIHTKDGKFIIFKGFVDRNPEINNPQIYFVRHVFDGREAFPLDYWHIHKNKIIYSQSSTKSKSPTSLLSVLFFPPSIEILPHLHFFN